MASSKRLVIEILTSVGAILRDDHFVFTTGRHSDTYINKDALYPHTQETSEVCRLFAEHCVAMDIQTVVAPALGGIVLSQWTAHFLSQMKSQEIVSVYAEKTLNSQFAFTRGYHKLVAGKRVLVLEDTTTTGGSVKKVIDVVRATGGEIVSVGVMVNRDQARVTSATLDAPFFALGNLQATSYLEDEVPEWLQKRPINTEVGHGKKYLEQREKS